MSASRGYSALLSLFFATVAWAQDGSVEPIAVQGRPYPDSIILRWAPRDIQTWQLGNNIGYRIQRYLLSRDNKVVQTPDKTLLVDAPLKPYQQERWASLVQSDKYAAIAAQALFGERFEIDLTNAGVLQIVDKIRENEQRFSFALFCADMSTKAADALGLRFVDKLVEPGEKYLYRVVIDGMDSLRGSLFMGTNDKYSLPAPLDVQATPGPHEVTIRWGRPASHLYTGFILERSLDGKTFTQASNEPFVTLSGTPKENTRYEYAVDSLPDTLTTFYYRVRGLTPFGELGEPSESVSVHATSLLTAVPQIISGKNIENRFVDLTWSFANAEENLIIGFSIERTQKPGNSFTGIIEGLKVDTRNFRDVSPALTNYYRVVAHDSHDRKIFSPLYYVELIDSIPPSVPTGLAGEIDENGRVELVWQSGREKDLAGYRIYRANFSSEELFQVTPKIIPDSHFTDSVNLKTLNNAIYYSVMAIDASQNHSGLSPKVKLSLPDKVKPQPPVILPVESSVDGVSLKWLPGASDDIAAYRVYRKGNDDENWQLIASVPEINDSSYHWVDTKSTRGQWSAYVITSVDRTGNESDPSGPVAGVRILSRTVDEVQWRGFELDAVNHKVTLKWEFSENDILNYRLYRSVNDKQLILFRTLPRETHSFTDQINPGTHLSYRIMAVLTNGRKSMLNKSLDVKF